MYQNISFYIDETTITESLAIHVDDEIMEYDGRDYNKKTCFPIVKKDNKKGKMKFIKINENIYRRLEILPLDVGINIRNINFTSLCESPVSMAICPLSYKSRHIFQNIFIFIWTFYAAYKSHPSQKLPAPPK